MSEKRFTTCSCCGDINDSRWIQFLDDKPLCYSCMDGCRFGRYRKACAERGYHITAATSGGWIGRQPADSSQPWMFRVEATCKCNASASFIIETRSAPMLNSDGSPMSIWGVAMGGYSMPSAPKQWFVLEGKATEVVVQDGESK